MQSAQFGLWDHLDGFAVPCAARPLHCRSRFSPFEKLVAQLAPLLSAMLFLICPHECMFGCQTQSRSLPAVAQGVWSCSTSSVAFLSHWAIFPSLVNRCGHGFRKQTSPHRSFVIFSGSGWPWLGPEVLGVQSSLANSPASTGATRVAPLLSEGHPGAEDMRQVG